MKKRPRPSLILRRKGHDIIMDESRYPQRVTLGEDQVYRWSYDMDMYKNHYLRNVLLKVFGAICLVCWLFLLFLFAQDGRLSLRVALYTLLIFGGVMLLVLAGYYLAAAVMRGRYHLRFEMNEEAVLLVRAESTERMMENMALITMMAGMAAGKPMRGLASGTALRAGAASGLTFFHQVRSMKERPQYDAFNLRSLTGGNQIWVGPEDYAFVRDYVRSRIPEKARH